MNKRIEIISNYINETDKIADIGCDQALLSEVLAKRNIYSIASDIKKTIVDSAQKRIGDLNLSEYVKFIVSDGVKKIDDSVDTVVLSGMGTYTILKILKDSNKQYKKVITISNNNHDILRTKMLELGYEIDKEEIIYEKSKFYNLILFKIGYCEYSEEEVLFGKNHQNSELFIKKIEYDLNKYKKIYKLNKSKDTYRKIEIIEKRLECH